MSNFRSLTFLYLFARHVRVGTNGFSVLSPAPSPIKAAPLMPALLISGHQSGYRRCPASAHGLGWRL